MSIGFCLKLPHAGPGAGQSAGEDGAVCRQSRDLGGGENRGLFYRKKEDRRPFA